MEEFKRSRLLLIDTCGETAGVGVCVGREVVVSEALLRVAASAEIVAAMRRVLAAVGWKLAELDTVGVVTGPGSFTGMRTGLAAAKGLCEATGVRLVGVSRLEVLADAAGARTGFVALDAGRREVYVREVASGREWTCGDEELMRLVGETEIGQEDSKQGRGVGSGVEVIVAEERVMERLGGERVRLYPLQVGDALGVVLRRLPESKGDAGLVEVNYVRGEQDIYRKSGVAAKARA